MQEAHAALWRAQAEATAKQLEASQAWAELEAKLSKLESVAAHLEAHTVASIAGREAARVLQISRHVAYLERGMGLSACSPYQQAVIDEILLERRKELLAAVEAAAPERMPAETQFTKEGWNLLLRWLSGRPAG